MADERMALIEPVEKAADAEVETPSGAAKGRARRYARTSATGIVSAPGVRPGLPHRKLLETDDAWAVARRHLGPESLARTTHTPGHRLPALAA